MPVVDGVSETEVGLPSRATRVRDPVCGWVFVRLQQIARALCIDTRYRRPADFAGCVLDCQLAGEAQDSTEWYGGWALSKIDMEQFLAKSDWF